MKRYLNYGIIPAEDIDKVKKLGSRLTNLTIDYFIVEKDNQGYKFFPIQNRLLLMAFPDLKTHLLRQHLISCRICIEYISD